MCFILEAFSLTKICLHIQLKSVGVASILTEKIFMTFVAKWLYVSVENGISFIGRADVGKGGSWHRVAHLVLLSRLVAERSSDN